MTIKQVAVYMRQFSAISKAIPGKRRWGGRTRKVFRHIKIPMADLKNMRRMLVFVKKSYTRHFREYVVYRGERLYAKPGFVEKERLLNYLEMKIKSILINKEK